MAAAAAARLPDPVSPAAVRLRGRGASDAHAWLLRLLVLALVAGAVLAARHYLIGDNSHPQGRTQRIKLVAAPRPPPPKAKEEPPKPQEKAPEEERPSDRTSYQGQLALVENTTPGPPGPPGERPLDDQLGVEAEGEGPGDSFGLVAKRGGHDITRLGSGGSGGVGGITWAQQRMLFNGYGETIAQRLAKDLQDAAGVLAREYVVVTLIWIDPRGRLTRSELKNSTGSAETDSALRRALAEASILPEPPSGLPQPLMLRFTVKKVPDEGPPQLMPPRAAQRPPAQPGEG
jgi:TonB family protein